ncbi:MAG: hypothetical protein WA476_08135 [Acidobacteriaceae bacterium]
MNVRPLLTLLATMLSAASLLGQSSITNQQSLKAIADLLEAPPMPLVLVSPASKGALRTLLIEQPGGLLTIADQAQPELRLAGLRWNPRTNGPSSQSCPPSSAGQ